NQESAKEYEELFNKFSVKMGELMTSENTSSPEYIAEKIFEAATDGSDKLRYLLGKDAEQYVEMRKQLGDQEYMKAISDLALS
ncbi:MAG: short-chain dehydrogenase/reductase, partial [Rhodothermaceae bacterium]